MPTVFFSKHIQGVREKMSVEEYWELARVGLEYPELGGDFLNTKVATTPTLSTYY